MDSLGLVHDADSLEGIIERTYAGLEDPDVIPMVTTTPITDETAEYFLGLKDLSQVEEAVASEAAIGSIPHSVCLVRAKDGVDVYKRQVYEPPCQRAALPLHILKGLPVFLKGNVT